MAEVHLFVDSLLLVGEPLQLAMMMAVVAKLIARLLME